MDIIGRRGCGVSVYVINHLQAAVWLAPEIHRSTSYFGYVCVLGTNMYLLATYITRRSQCC